VHDSVDTNQGFVETGSGGHVALRPIVALAGLSAQHTRVVPGLTQPRHHLASEGARAACDKNVHRGIRMVLENVKRGKPVE
jgi:hypothetical protein